MALQFLKHRWQRIAFYTVLIGIVLAIAISVAVNAYVKPMLQDKLKSSILESSDSLYSVNFSNADIQILRGSVTVDSATLKVNSAVYQQKKKDGKAPNNLYDLQVKQVRLSGISLAKMYFSKKVDVDRIVLIDPRVDMSYEPNFNEDKPSKDTRTIWQRISKSLHSVRVGEIVLNNLKFRHTDYSDNKARRTEVREMNLNAIDLFIDSTTQNDTSRLFYCSDIITEVSNYSGKTGDGLYGYNIKNLKFSTHTKQLNIKGLNFKPINSLLFFTKTNSDRFSLTLDSLRINQFNFFEYYRYRTFSASAIKLSNGTLSVFGSPNKTPNYTRDNVGSFPHVALRNLKFNLRVDTINIKKLDVVYSEHNSKSNKNGTLTFKYTTGRMLNFTNNKKALQKNNIAKVDLTTYFMGKGRLDVAFRLNLTAENAAFSYKGSLGPMKLSELNNAIGPLSMVKVSSGNLQRFDFDVDANRYVAKGKIKMLYDNLKINILKVDDDGRLKKKGLMSLLANAFVIERNNPDEPGKTPRTANIIFKRPVNYPFFKLAWKVLFAGVKECAGVSEMDEKKANSKMSEGDLKKVKKKKG